MQTSPNPIAQGVSEPGGKSIKLQVLEIGSWNMDALTSVNVAHSLDLSKIVGVNAVIRRDDYAFLYNLDVNLTWTTGEGYVEVGVAFITVGRRGGGYWDNVNYNDAVMNRGFIMVWYYE